MCRPAPTRNRSISTAATSSGSDPELHAAPTVSRWITTGFTLSADSLVLAVMTSSEVDGYLTLYDAAGNVLRSDDNSYGCNDPLIVQYLPAGTYKLAARATLAAPWADCTRWTCDRAGARPPFCARAAR